MTMTISSKSTVDIDVEPVAIDSGEGVDDASKGDSAAVLGDKVDDG